MNRGIFESRLGLITFFVALSFPGAVLSQTDAFENLMAGASHAAHAKLTSAKLMEQTQGGATVSCGVMYQAEIMEDFIGRSAQGEKFAFRGGSSLMVGGEYLVILNAPSTDISDGRCGEVRCDEPVLEAHYLIRRGSAPAKTHPHDERIGVIENLRAPFPDSIDVQQRSYRDCRSADSIDEGSCPVVKLETIFVWDELSNLLRRRASLRDTAAAAGRPER